jgi:hypothetical protein
VVPASSAAAALQRRHRRRHRRTARTAMCYSPLWSHAEPPEALEAARQRPRRTGRHGNRASCSQAIRTVSWGLASGWFCSRRLRRATRAQARVCSDTSRLSRAVSNLPGRCGALRFNTTHNEAAPTTARLLPVTGTVNGCVY